MFVDTYRMLACIFSILQTFLLVGPGSLLSTHLNRGRSFFECIGHLHIALCIFLGIEGAAVVLCVV